MTTDACSDCLPGEENLDGRRCENGDRAERREKDEHPGAHGCAIMLGPEAERTASSTRLPVHPLRSGARPTHTWPSRAQRLIEAAMKPVPEGTFAVGRGLIVSGSPPTSSRSSRSARCRRPSTRRSTASGSSCSCSRPGSSCPLEQEVGRAVAHRRAQDVGGGPVVRRAALAGSLLCAALIVFVLLAEGVIARRRHRRPRRTRCSTARRCCSPA